MSFSSNVFFLRKLNYKKTRCSTVSNLWYLLAVYLSELFLARTSPIKAQVFFPRTSPSVGSPVFHGLELSISGHWTPGHQRAISPSYVAPKPSRKNRFIFCHIFRTGYLTTRIQWFDVKNICKQKQKSDSIRPFPWGSSCSRIRD